MQYFGSQLVGSKSLYAGQATPIPEIAAIRELSLEEINFVSGGDVDWACENSDTYGFCSAWDTTTGAQLTITWELDPNLLGSLTLTEVFSYNGDNIVLTQNTWEQLAAGLVGAGATFMAMGLGGTAAAAIGTASAFAFTKMMKSVPKSYQPVASTQK